MASISQFDATATSVSVRLIDLNTTYAKSDRVCDWYINYYEYQGQSTIAAYVSSGGDYTITGLSPGTEYVVRCIVSAPDWADKYEYSDIATTSSSGGDSGGDSGGGDTSGGGAVYIMGSDGLWHQCTPYIMGSDGLWHQCTPYIMGSDGLWHQC